MSSKLSVVLVHGALTGASVWNHVIDRLRAADVTVFAPAMPLRGLSTDVAYLSSFLESIDGEVVLVGHSYGGSVISHPDLANQRIRALVYVSAFAPDANESTGELNGRWPGSKLGAETTIVRHYPGGADLYLKADCFADVYAGDVAPEISAIMAITQRPLDPAALGESFADTPLWHTVPSWALVSTEDNSLPVAAQRFMADRAGARTREVDTSHASPVTRPGDVVALIEDARNTVAR